MHNQKKGKKKIQTNVKWRWEKHYISTKTNPKLKPNRRIPKNQKSNKNCIQKKKKEKTKSNNKNFMILLCHRFDNKGRRRKRGNLQRKKKQKQKNLNPKQPTTTNKQNSMKNKNKQKKNLNPKQAQTNKIPWTIEADRERAIYRNYAK